MSKVFISAAVLASAVLLTACGDAAPPPPPPPPPSEKGLFISATDCAESGKLSAELCAQAIDTAVAIHEQQAPAFKSLRQCAAAMGPDRCDKSVDGHYRARLQAFFVTMSNPPDAFPLYPGVNGFIGFRSATKEAIDARNEDLVVSTAAMTVANENALLAAPPPDGE